MVAFLIVDAEGYTYVQSFSRGTKVYWKCRLFRKEGCPARATTNKEKTDIINSGHHQHPPRAEEERVEGVESNAIDDAVHSSQTPRAVIANLQVFKFLVGLYR